MSWQETLQTNLKAKNLYTGTVDGILGPKSLEGLFRFCGATTLAEPLARAGAVTFPEFGIIERPARVREWFAENGHETMGFKKLREIWGPTAAQRGYEGRLDLGNTEPGDGKRFLGRGTIHLTGRKNYRRLKEIILARFGVDILLNPELVERSDIAVFTSCLYWRDNKLNDFADQENSLMVSVRINGRNRKTGLPNGIEDRNDRKSKLRRLMS